MFLPVNDDSSDLLVHEDEDGAEESRDAGDDDGPPGVGAQGVDQPTTVVSGRLWEMFGGYILT